MRKVIAEIAVSLDGYIEGPNGELDWLIFDEEQEYVNEFLSKFEVIFYGRVAYERFGAFFNREHNYTETVCSMRKYVFSNTVKHVPGNGMVINDNIEETVMQIREEEGKDIWLCGGAGIIQTFTSLNLVDEYILAVQPVVLGTGKRLFGNIPLPLKLDLIDTERLTSGVVILHYRPAYLFVK
jgi:dihydrofolate reductase